MKYNGPLYGKIGKKYVKLKQTSDYVEALENENARLRDTAQAVINLKRCVINARNAAEAIIAGEKPLSIAEALLDNCNDTLDT